MAPKKKKGRSASQSRGSRAGSRAGSEAPGEKGGKKKKKVATKKPEELTSPSSILKFVALLFSLICYGMLIGVHSDIQTPYERILVCALFSGFMVLYLSLVVGIVTGKSVDRILAAVWALYASSVYLGCAVLLIIKFHKYSLMGLAVGILAMVQAIICLADCWFTSKIMT